MRIGPLLEIDSDALENGSLRVVSPGPFDGEISELPLICSFAKTLWIATCVHLGFYYQNSGPYDGLMCDLWSAGSDKNWGSH